MLKPYTWRERLAARRMVWRVRASLLEQRLWLWCADLTLRWIRRMMRWEWIDNNCRNDMGVQALRLEAVRQDLIRRGTWTYLKDLG